MLEEIAASLATWKEAFTIHSRIEDELFLPILAARLKRVGIQDALTEELTTAKDHDEVEALIRKGRLLEKSVLVTAVKAHIEDRIIVYNNKCVVFGD